MNTTVKTRYGLQYLTMRLSRYMNSPTETAFLALRHGIEYLTHHPHLPIMYSIYFVNKLNTKSIYPQSRRPQKNQEYSNFLHTYCDAYNARDISDRCSVTSTAHSLNGSIIDQCTEKNM